jgi:hypothetical protein
MHSYGQSYDKINMNLKLTLTQTTSSVSLNYLLNISNQSSKSIFYSYQSDNVLIHITDTMLIIQKTEDQLGGYDSIVLKSKDTIFVTTNYYKFKTHIENGKSATNFKFIEIKPNSSFNIYIKDEKKYRYLIMQEANVLIKAWVLTSKEAVDNQNKNCFYMEEKNNKNKFGIIKHFKICNGIISNGDTIVEYKYLNKIFRPRFGLGFL